MSNDDIFDFYSKEPKGIFVRVKKNNLDGALKALKKKIIQEGLIKEIRKREYYITGTEKRRRQRVEARKRWLRKQKKMLEND
ncbi:MAG: 30S ribosomal protein S21 [Candidatus Aenigmatarchaeota archaeon]